MTDALLSVRNAAKRFGGVVAVDDVTFAVERSGAVGVIGPNGAGKSTLLKMIAGEHACDRGEIWFDGRRVDRLPRHRRARVGIALAHQIPKPFRRLTVRDNIRVGALERDQKGASNLGEHVDEVLESTGLTSCADRPAGTLGLLDLKRLELARALSLSPKLLLLDEVGAGLIAGELEAMIVLVDRIRTAGVTLILVEHVEQVVSAVASRVIVLDWGRVVTEGEPAAIAADPDVRALYLGTGATSGLRRAQEIDSVRRDAPADLLRVEGVSVDYGGAHALCNVNLEVRDGEVVAVLGANGAGKTTLANVIAGLKRPLAGRVVFAGEDVTAVPAHRRVSLGLAYGHEGRHIFPNLTVQENLRLGAYPRRTRPGEADRREAVCALFPELAERLRQRAGTLSGGQQQMLAIGRALMSSPRLLILDEVSLGLAPIVVDRVYEALRVVADDGLSILLIEQNVHRSLALADRAYVLDHGLVSFCGAPRELEEQGRLWQVYFGANPGPAHQTRSHTPQRKEMLA